MNNFRFDMTAVGSADLLMAFKLVFSATDCDGTTYSGTKRGVTHYAIRPPKEGVRNDAGGWAFGQDPKVLRLVFFFNEYDLGKTVGDKVALPFRLDSEGAADFARRWLGEADYGREPDIDGTTKKGWRLFNEGWGRVDSDHSAVIAVTPAWAMYGK